MLVNDTRPLLQAMDESTAVLSKLVHVSLNSVSQFLVSDVREAEENPTTVGWVGAPRDQASLLGALRELHGAVVRET